MTELIQPALDRLRKVFRTGKTKKADWRKAQLKALKKGIDEMRIQLQSAVEKDLGRSTLVTEVYEIKPCEWAIEHGLANLDTYMKDVVLDTPLRLAPGRTKVRYEPLGVALIFGSWNYPYIVTLKPLIQAITSGNCVVVKPSEMSPHTSAVMKALVEQYLDKECFEVIEGGPEVAAAITKYPWDLICFTGSTMKGKLVAEAAGKNLVPCILELGGKCPAIVDASANVDFAAAKIAFGRFINSGQTCLAPDYVIAHDSIVQELITRLQHHTKTMFGTDPSGSLDQGKIIADWHCDRLKKVIDTAGGEIICGGKVTRDIKNVEPTIILNPKLDSDAMNEEIFGPILPIISFSNIGDAINTINDKDKALAVYYFGRPYMNGNLDRVNNETTSGAFLVNEVISHIVNPSFGFGGVGGSGYGRYGGFEGFKQFSNTKSVMIKATTNHWPYTCLLPPYTEHKKSMVKMMLGLDGTQSGVAKVLLFLLIASFLIYVGFHWHFFFYNPAQNFCHKYFP